MASICASHWSNIEKPGARTVSRIALGVPCSNEQLLEVAVGGEAVVAAGGGEDVAASAMIWARRGHPLHGLVEVLVQGVAAVGGHDDGERPVARRPWRSPGEGAAASWAVERVAAVEARDRAVPVQRDVDAEVEREERAVPRICSWVGLPASTPQVDFGSAMTAARW